MNDHQIGNAQRLNFNLDLTKTHFMTFSIEEDWISLSDIALSSQEVHDPMYFEVHSFLGAFGLESLTDLQNLKVGEKYLKQSPIIMNDKDYLIDLVIIRIDALIFEGTIQSAKDEENMKLSRSYVMLLDSMTECVAQYDSLGRLTYCNPTFEKAFSPSMFPEYNIYVHADDSKWFTDCLMPPYCSTSMVHYRDKDMFIQWTNHGILENGQVTMVSSIGVDITELQKSREQLLFEVNHDEESRFLNERGIKRKIESLADASFVLYYLQIYSIDHIYGAYGEEVYMSTVHHINKIFQQFQDDHTAIGRISYREYVLLTEKESRDLEDRLVASFTQEITIDGFNLYLASDIGKVAYPDDTNDIHSILPFGDLASRLSSEQHELTIHRFKPEHYQRMRNTVSLLADLQLAVKNREIKVVFQEIVNALSGEVLMVEALARWNHPKRGPIPPAEFFALANRSYFGSTLDYLVIDKALATFAQMKQTTKYRQTRLAINISPKTFVAKNFCSRLVSHIKNQQVSLDDVCVEISENTFEYDTLKLKERIDELRSQGIMVALDDFGSKYSSLRVLNQIQFDIIKIDKSFTDSLHMHGTRVILEMLCQFAQDLEKIIVMEGVETSDQVATLVDMGFSTLQGYYFSKPLPFNPK